MIINVDFLLRYVKRNTTCLRLNVVGENRIESSAVQLEQGSLISEGDSQHSQFRGTEDTGVNTGEKASAFMKSTISQSILLPKGRP